MSDLSGMDRTALMMRVLELESQNKILADKVAKDMICTCASCTKGGSISNNLKKQAG